ncbi:VOC family protein [Actinoplanes sp. TBRC 11911]|uniref:VOC family protein n=1 Tax=Actinoplanes sp. TBRC 11911 TaxID=2729386 RepID=UPI00145EEAE7|nr:VOC family protein [Actinoplanes sp. TBRC 11911]NMO54580.1 VOC family protein [Actinoplanes sp. TBRC 11911]
MLDHSAVEANIPAADLDRARQYYADTFGLMPVEEFGGEALRYRTAGGTFFNVYRTEYAGQAGHTIAQWHVDDVDQEVRELTAKGVDFEIYPDMPGVEWSGPVATIPGLGKAAWFKDSEGNIMCVDDGMPKG